MRSGFSGHQRKALIRSLDARPALDRGRKADRPQQYGQEAVAALKAVWEASDRACGKRLRPFLPELVGVSCLERHGKLVLQEWIVGQGIRWRRCVRPPVVIQGH